MSWLVDPYRSTFMLRALGAVVVIGAFSPMVGVWIVLRRLSYLGDAMSHALLAGVAVSLLLGISISAGALAAGLAMAGLLSLLSLHPRLAVESVIGVAETTLFGIGLILVSRYSDQIGYDLPHFLLGQVSTTTRGDLVANSVLAVIGAALVLAVFHDLRAATFDPVHAALVGIRTGLLTWLLLSLLAVAIVVSLQTVGLLMSVAMLVVPPVAARLLTDRLVPMTVVAMAIGVGSGVVGLTASYHLESPPGATISLVAVAVLMAALFAPAERRRRRGRRHAGGLTSPAGSTREELPCDESEDRPSRHGRRRPARSRPGSERSSTSARTSP